MERVYIIESPAPRDLFRNRCEGRALSEALLLAETDVHYRLAANRESFDEAMTFIIEDFHAKSGKSSAMPFIHISAHGDDAGIQLTDGDYFEWDDFRSALEKINEKIGYVPFLTLPVSQKISRVALCFSTCDGYNAHKIHLSDPCPFQFLVGPISKVSWPDSLTAFQVFYHAANCRKTTYAKAVELMNQATGLSNVFQSYISPELDSLAKVQIKDQEDATPTSPLSEDSGPPAAAR